MLLNITVIVTGLTIFGEALVLFIGMQVLQRDNPWLTWQNRVWLYSDLLFGFALVTINRDAHALYFYALLLVITLAHVYREYEYVSDRDGKFCFNLPLFIVNNMKLMGLFAIVILIAIERLHTTP